jgi:hypothetical protein
VQSYSPYTFGKLLSGPTLVEELKAIAKQIMGGCHMDLSLKV